MTSLGALAVGGRRALRAGVSPVRLAGFAAASLALIPLLFVAALAVAGQGGDAVPLELLLRYARDTAIVGLMVLLGASIVGAWAAWLVVMYDFPGRRTFEWALALPLAAPAYALAYSWADLLDVAGPIRGAARALIGIDLPLEVRNPIGAGLILAGAFYPYVYLTARSAFVSQSVCSLEAARTLGCRPLQAFWRVALPMARPAIAAGAALALMETLADYGAVSFLGVQTLTTGVVRSWASYGAPASAARLALVLLGVAAVLLWVERVGRRGQGYGASSQRWRTLPRAALAGPPAWAATAFCGALLTAALIAPATRLAILAAESTPEWGRLAGAAIDSLGLAAAGAVLTVVLAAAVAFGARGSRFAGRVVSLGYATPGVVMAVGLLAPAGLLWRSFGGAAAASGVALALLLFAYAARLMAAAVEPIDAGLARVTPSMDRAARSLGQTETGAMRRVHAPLAGGALFTAALLVFVDVLKELPATLILRPFNFDTLAVLADNYAADERLGAAAWPALMILALAVWPVVRLSRAVSGSRPGAIA